MHQNLPSVSPSGLPAGKIHRFTFRGAELNPIAALQETFTSLEPSKMSSTAIALISPSRQGVERMTRTWPRRWRTGGLMAGTQGRRDRFEKCIEFM
jgi:hypothetical protein